MFVADLHNDILQRAIIGEDVSKLTNKGHSDFIRLIESCIDLEIIVVWITGKYLNSGSFKRANEFIDRLEDIEKLNQKLKIIKNVDDIINSKQKNILSTPFSLEGGEPLEDKIDNLYHFIQRGMLYFGLTWNRSLSWVSSAYDEEFNHKNIKSLGLNNFGKEVVRVCNENGVIIDVSHIGEKSFWDIIKLTKKPLIASHSSVRNLCNHFRNLKDEQIIAIKEKEGLIGLNPYPLFIDPNFKKQKDILQQKYYSEIENIKKNQVNESKQWLEIQHFMQKKLNSISPSIEIFVDHIEYIIKLIGIDYVGIGSDYDGLDCLPKEMKDCRDHILIAHALEHRGYNNNEIEKIMGLNFLRVYEKVKN